MSGGFTPFDKNSYKESKRRRKQALIEEKTGRILPVSNPVSYTHLTLPTT